MIIKIARDFSRAPGTRHRVEGKNSGEEFRDTILCPKVREAIDLGVPITVDLDGTFGLGTSFLEEAFGGLIRIDKIDYHVLTNMLNLVSKQEPYLIAEIEQYMKDAHENEAR